MEWQLLVAGGVVGLAGILLANWFCSPRLRNGVELLSEEDRRSLVDWERSRALDCAKGAAATAAGFLVTLVTAAFTGDYVENVSLLAVAGSAAGAVALLGFAAKLSIDSSRFAFRVLGHAPVRK